MKNSFTSPYSLPFMSEFKKERESKINLLINNLKINDVKEDKSFENTTSRIKKSVLLAPVLMGEPKVVDHTFEEIPLSFEQQVIGVGSRNHYTHEVSFPFTGDAELFSHKPENSFSVSSSDHGVISPYSNSITVYVDLPELNPERAIVEARRLLGLTLQFMGANSASIQGWSASVGQRIDEQLKRKREELIKLLGDKQSTV